MSTAVSAIEDVAPAIVEEERTMPRGKVVHFIKHWVREPLLHFFIIGLALFAIYRLITPAGANPTSNRIELTQNDLSQLESSWRAQWQRPPSPDEMRSLINDKLKQEILYREGLALGLDQGDEIIKRRMAQKMEFLAEDVSNLREPSTEELKAWFEKNSVRFALPGGVTFHHLYFSPDKRGSQARDDASMALDNLAGRSAEASGLGDRFMFQNYYADNSPEQVAKIFGIKFSESISKLRTGFWQGPVESGLGWHLVWIDAITPGRVPAFGEVDPAHIKSEWSADQRADSKRQLFEAIKQRYEVVLPPSPKK
jgi:peptidyl-prolyl cis-trans isomerase C